MNISIVVPFHVRFNYLEITLLTLDNAIKKAEQFKDIVNICVYLFEDPSRIEFTLTEPMISYMMHIKNTRVLGPNGNPPHAISFAATYSDYVLCIDSDTIIHPDLILHLHNFIENSHLNIGSIFNTKTHKFIESNDIIGKKEAIGGNGMIVSSSFWKKYINSNTKEHIGWDWNICAYAKKVNEPIYCSVRSLIDHFGQTESHSGPACDIDRAIRFIN